MAPVPGRGWLGSPRPPHPQIATGFVCQGHNTQPSIPALGLGSTQIWGGGLNVQGALCHPRDRGGPAAELGQPAAEAQAAFWRCHVDRAAQSMGVGARRGLWCSPDSWGVDGEGEEIPAPLSARGAGDAPREHGDIPLVSPQQDRLSRSWRQGAARARG